MRKLLFPFSILYAGIMRIRNYCYDKNIFASFTSPLPVISVGNISVGGNGKTPFVFFLCKFLQGSGHFPVVLSRGYGGTMLGPHVLTQQDAPSLVGDEPLLLAQKMAVPSPVSVVIARQRVLGAQLIEARKLGDCIVLDDGFQHRALGRNLDILLVSTSSQESVEQFFSDFCLPAGDLRESPLPALRRAQILVLFSQSPTAVEEGTYQEFRKRLPPSLALATAKYDHMKLEHSVSGKALAPQRILAFSAIARPAAFRQSLESLGYSVDSFVSFPDHYSFTESDLIKIRKDTPELPMVCTEKDLVKIPKNYRSGLYVLSGELVLDRGLEAFAALVEKALRKGLDAKTS